MSQKNRLANRLAFKTEVTSKKVIFRHAMLFMQTLFGVVTHSSQREQGMRDELGGYVDLVPRAFGKALETWLAVPSNKADKRIS